MKFVVTGRAQHLGEAGKAVEMTTSQALYERLRGHVAPMVTHIDPLPTHIDPPAADAAPALRPARRRKRT